MTGESTGESLISKPKVMQKLIDRIKPGMGVSDAARSMGIAPQTVRAARAKLPDFDRALADKMNQALVMASDNYVDALSIPAGQPGSVNVNYLPVHIQKLVETRSALLGSSPASTEQSGPSVGTVLDELRQLCSGQSLTVTVSQVSVSASPSQPAPAESAVIECDNLA